MMDNTHTQKKKKLGDKEAPKPKMQAVKDRPTATRSAGHRHLRRQTKKEAQQGIYLMRHPEKRTPTLPVSILERKACWTKLRTLTKPEEASLLPTAGECKT